MHGPASLGWLLVALCAATGAYCLLRMRSADEGQRRAAGGEAVMGFGMAAMAVPAGVFTPPGWAWPVYLTVFGAAAVHALWAARGSAHHLHHLVGALAMVYMAAVMALSPSHVHAHGSSGVPLLTGVLLLYFAAYVLASGARLVPVTSGGASGGGSGTGGGGSSGSGDGGSAGRPGWADRPELARACRLSMGIGMLAMLITM
ncbi:DUF5134 domain-containing protein [Streptomyces roseirectus]|uniref:DUF5134 domain-containing protein n=1 Tax=Streptomyces roseirectus TaxID=2768066 RepID=A0A7H0I815_9ACTN|nr:DUF5134 domain-containing protein [Streptomyces roseirectus]QNP68931.1 DUF5134 domain-containing protein [Streptomyces roseirectus]